jgi:Mce-associated membrane protein
VDVTGAVAGSLGPVSEDPGPARPLPRWALVGLVLLVAVGAWSAYRAYSVRATEATHAQMVTAARAGLVNLTSIDHERVEADVARIIESSTGAFRDDFAARAEPFAEAARTARSTSVGTVDEAGLESASGDRGVVLVALTVMTSNRGVADAAPRAWRTRVNVERVDGSFKVSAVEFVP